MTIYKYTIPLQDEISVEMPTGAEILSSQVQNGEIQVWAKVEPAAICRPVLFRIIGTGHPFPDGEWQFVDTVQCHGGDLVFHIFYQV